MAERDLIPAELAWVGSSLRDLHAFPEEVRHVIGFALYLAQTGGKHANAKPLRGFGGAGVAGGAHPRGVSRSQGRQP